MILSCCGKSWIDVSTSLGWGLVTLIVILVALCIIKSLFIKYFKSKSTILEQHLSYERQMKDDAFEREKFWRIYKSKEEPLEEAIIKLEKELDSYKKKEKELQEKMNNFEKEKSRFEKTILEEKIKVYQQIIKETK